MAGKDKDEALETWLSNQKGRYKQKCSLVFGKYLRFLKEKYNLEMNGDRILAQHIENRKSEDLRVKYFFDDTIQPFMAWMETQGNAHNSAVVHSGMLRSFFKYYRMRLEVQSRIGFNETKKRYHIYTHDELVKMVEAGDLEARALIMLGVQLGIRVNDFVALKRQPILEAYQNANGEFPLEFEIETQKEKVISIGHISKEVYEALQYYWDSIPQSEYVFPFNGSHIIDQRANDILKNCWLKAFPERTTQKIRFHELRSYKISALANCGVNSWAIMKMTGKKVSQDISTYLTGLNLRELFMKGEQALTLTHLTNNNHTAIEELKKENQELKNKVSRVETEIADIKKIIEKLI